MYPWGYTPEPAPGRGGAGSRWPGRWPDLIAGVGGTLYDARARPRGSLYVDQRRHGRLGLQPPRAPSPSRSSSRPSTSITAGFFNDEAAIGAVFEREPAGHAPSGALRHRPSPARGPAPAVAARAQDRRPAGHGREANAVARPPRPRPLTGGPAVRLLAPAGL
ncbi:MAG: hypothetical protein M0C28_39185 [Candidatus Moduliflexus flocculans]|nr:hypothetical protein [Candidatus Moduliflexus flocculans]